MSIPSVWFARKPLTTVVWLRRLLPPEAHRGLPVRARERVQSGLSVRARERVHNGVSVRARERVIQDC